MRCGLPWLFEVLGSRGIQASAWMNAQCAASCRLGLCRSQLVSREGAGSAGPAHGHDLRHVGSDRRLVRGGRQDWAGWPGGSSQDEAWSNVVATVQAIALAVASARYQKVTCRDTRRRW